MAWSYVRWPLAEVKVLSMAAFDCSRSGRARVRFGAFLRRGLGVDLRIGDGLQSVAGQLHPDSSLRRIPLVNGLNLADLAARVAFEHLDSPRIIA